MTTTALPAVLSNVAVALGFKLIWHDTADRATEPQYALLYNNEEVHFSGTARECSAFLTGWRDLRARVLGELLVADTQALPLMYGQTVSPPRARKVHGGAKLGVTGELAAIRTHTRDQRQGMITAWAETAFGHEEATDLPHRGLRLLEEAVETFQACAGTETVAHKLVTFVFNQPPGRIGQELGGVAVSMLALAAAAGLSAEEEECREIHRVLSNSIQEFTRRNASKNAAGFKLSVSAEKTP